MDRDMRMLIAIGLGAVGAWWLASWLLTPSSKVNVTIIPPGEPIRATLQGVWK